MLSITAIAILCFIFGSIIGSFLGVCAYRIPMCHYEPAHDGVRELAQPVTILKPARSFCPQCEQTLPWWHNIPLVSYIALRGRCGMCKARIPFRYLFIEILTGLLCAACYLRFGASLTGCAAFALIAALVVIIFIDIDYMIIPDIITYPGTAIGLAIAAANQYLAPPHQPFFHSPFVPDLYEAGLGLLLGPGVLLFVWALYWLIRRREGLGLGDIKLLAVLGAMFGGECAWFTILVGSILGSVFGLAAIVLRRREFQNYIPFGPYLVVGAIAYLLQLDRVAIYLLHHEGPSPWRMMQGLW